VDAVAPSERLLVGVAVCDGVTLVVEVGEVESLTVGDGVPAAGETVAPAAEALTVGVIEAAAPDDTLAVGIVEGIEPTETVAEAVCEIDGVGEACPGAGVGDGSTMLALKNPGTTKFTPSGACAHAVGQTAESALPVTSRSPEATLRRAQMQPPVPLKRIS